VPIVLKRADGLSRQAVAAGPGHGAHTVGTWRKRFAEHRMEGLSDA